jgi:hypothetical protein
MDRISDQTYVMYPYDVPLDLTKWNPPMEPFPPGFIKP